MAVLGDVRDPTMTRGSRWIWMGSGWDWTFGSFWKSAEELGSMIKPLAKNMTRSQPVAPWGSYCTQLDVVESCRTDDPPSAGLCPRFPWPRWCHWHGVLWSLPARVGPCASDKMALPVIRTAQVQPWATTLSILTCIICFSTLRCGVPGAIIDTPTPSWARPLVKSMLEIG